MSKIKWQTKADIDVKKADQEQKKIEKEKFKGKTLSDKERNELLEIMAKDLGYL